ncbi:hypothetical protein DXT68_15885 [Microbacterium foliorum]|uniref:Uncharacterized protein n=1 Tax=Microbacterium foliorum TaxID=104336 RepID=A0A0F0KW25_9MICO|nr:hypothetical protein [Microbacterium foliorum]AXL13445.1 hypothetical protein DXT68_15885 [Microbacterium foliorum]KJL25088.1 hypothetical protein RN50_00546 [Microbacterium foliorum]CAH0206170.1 hypothetical protein SRABI03_02107 [Microbacterium foliorum]CAH0215940.1 hypothetical protein SRABI44_02291 [Microbacterium foliorum]
MNATNRALNRTLLLIIGLLFLALGALGIAVMSWPTATDIWTSAGKDARTWLDQAIAATAIAGGSLSWVGIGAVAAIVIVVVLLIAALTSISGRRSKTVLRSSGAQNPLGRVTVTESFVSDAVKNSLADRADILSTHVTANDIHSEPVLHVALTPRQNTDPRELVDHVDRLLGNLATLTGRETATYVSIHTGLRARLAHDQRRLT